MKNATKSLLLVGLLASIGITEAIAASQLPATFATSFTTDMTDTHTDVMEWVWTIFPIVALGWFAFNQARKGAGKFGAK